MLPSPVLPPRPTIRCSIQTGTNREEEARRKKNGAEGKSVLRQPPFGKRVESLRECSPRLSVSIRTASIRTVLDRSPPLPAHERRAVPLLAQRFMPNVTPVLALDTVKRSISFRFRTRCETIDATRELILTMPNIDVKASVNFWLACIATCCPTQKTSFDIDAHRPHGDMIGVLSNQRTERAE